MMSRLGLEAMMSRLGRFGPRSSSGRNIAASMVVTLQWLTSTMAAAPTAAAAVIVTIPVVAATKQIQNINLAIILSRHKKHWPKELRTTVLLNYASPPPVDYRYHGC